MIQCQTLKIKILHKFSKKKGGGLNLYSSNQSNLDQRSITKDCHTDNLTLNNDYGKRMYVLISRLYRITRSITGDGFRDSLDIIDEAIGGGG